MDVKKQNTILKKAKSKAACERCRERKTKCSGTMPCSSCVTTKCECVFSFRTRRKPKKVTILNTEFESLRNRIKELEQEIISIKRGNTPLPVNDTFKEKVLQREDTNEEINLSIFLGSGASELICYNLRRLIQQNGAYTPGTETLIITPDFSSLIEEDIYDQFMVPQNNVPTTKMDLFSYLEDYCLKDVEKMFQALLLNISLGVLAIDPIRFIKTLRVQYYDSSGNFRVANPQSYYQYFPCKILMVIALGKLLEFSVSADMSGSGGNLVMPGLEAYQLVMRHLPPGIQMFSISHQNPSEAFEVIELLLLVAIYVRCFDKKNRAAMITINALELCIALNLHKKSIYRKYLDIDGYNNLNIFWSTFILNRNFSSRIGQPVLLRPQDIQTELPDYSFTVDSKLIDTTVILPRIDAEVILVSIKLAYIADDIITGVYSSRIPHDIKGYLKAILINMKKLIEIYGSFSDAIKVNWLDEDVFSTAAPRCLLENEGNDLRLILSLHLNYHHHIYLTCVPILLHLTRATVLSYLHPTKYSSIFHVDLHELPLTIKEAVKTCIISTNITVNIFMALHRKFLSRTFDTTELDYLCSSAVVLIICVLLKVDFGPVAKDSMLSIVTRKLETTIDLIIEMALNGNAVAKGKIKHLLALLIDLKDIFEQIGRIDIINMMEKYAKVSLKMPETLSKFGSTQTSLSSLLGSNIIGLKGSTLENMHPSETPVYLNNQNNSSSQLSEGDGTYFIKDGNGNQNELYVDPTYFQINEGDLDALYEMLNEFS